METLVLSLHRRHHVVSSLESRLVTDLWRGEGRHGWLARSQTGLERLNNGNTCVCYTGRSLFVISDVLCAPLYTGRWDKMGLVPRDGIHQEGPCVCVVSCCVSGNNTLWREIKVRKELWLVYWSFSSKRRFQVPIGIQDKSISGSGFVLL